LPIFFSAYTGRPWLWYKEEKEAMETIEIKLALSDDFSEQSEKWLRGYTDSVKTRWKIVKQG